MGFFIALLIALLSGMGVGGGGLFALYLKYATDRPQIALQAINLIFFIFAAGASLPVHLLRRRIFFLPIVIMLAFGIPGSILGSYAALALDGQLLSRLFGGVMISAGAYSLFKSQKRG